MILKIFFFKYLILKILSKMNFSVFVGNYENILKIVINNINIDIII